MKGLIKTMALRKTRGRLSPFSCGHRGFGVSCHRCAEADRMDAIANGTAKPKKESSFKGWTKERFLAEAKRLRAVPTKSSTAAPSLSL